MSEDPELALVREEFERAKAEAVRRLVGLLDTLADCDRRGRGRGLGGLVARARARNLRRLIGRVLRTTSMAVVIPAGPWGPRL